jgi:hypothetical protein
VVELITAGRSGDMGLPAEGSAFDEYDLDGAEG